MHEFRFSLNETVGMVTSDEVGKVIGRAEYLDGEDQYFVRYKAADGRQVENWWSDSALTRFTNS